MSKKRLNASLLMLSMIAATMVLFAPDRSTANNLVEPDSHPLFLPLVIYSHTSLPGLNPYLVKDIYPDVNTSTPICGAVLGDELFCRWQESLWKTDGTQTGTTKVKDVFISKNDEKWMVNYKDKVYFASSDGLWRTDGTERKTKLFDGRPSLHGSPKFTQAGNLLYFAADNHELWRSNGRESGTIKLKKFSDGVQNLTAYNGDLYFTADDGMNGSTLWKSDGTSDGTVMVKDTDIDPYGGNNPTSLTVAGNKLFFIANGPSHDWTLWVTDGSEPGTQPLQERVRDNSLVSFQDQLYYWTRSYVSGADDGELWRTDGTVPGIEKITDSLVPYYVIAGDSLIYFFPEEGNYQPEVWRSDGTAAGTFSLDAPLEPYFDERFFEDQTLVIGDHLFFAGFDEQSGIEPWLSDGTVPGTKLLADLYPGLDDSAPHNFRRLGDSVYFAARFPGGEAYWAADCDSTSAQIAVTLSYPHVHSSDPLGLTAVGDQLFFGANDGSSGRELWVSSGSEANTQLVKDIVPGQESSAPFGGQPGVSFKSNLIFPIIHNENELWRSNGRESGTFVIYTSEKPPGSTFHLLPATENFVYFIDGNSLYAGDGKPNGDTMLVTLGNGFVYDSAAAGKRLYFLYYNSDTNSSSLWASAGTKASTKELLQGVPNFAADLSILNGIAYFAGGSELWQSDGTNTGTKSVVTIAGGEINNLVAAGSHLFLSVKDSSGWSIWRSDGSQGGTEFLKTINSAVDRTYIYTLVAFGSNVLFLANDGIHGFEPWITDGTVEGTRLLKDIAAGESSSEADWMTPAGGQVFFSADDGLNGRELWVSDGSESGTKIVVDLVMPGGGGQHCQSGGSCPSQLTVAGNRLFFTAEENNGDFELWALNIYE